MTFLGMYAGRCAQVATVCAYKPRARETPEPGALHLTRRQDLLDIEIAATESITV